jgi:hypothetical protein
LQGGLAIFLRELSMEKSKDEKEEIVPVEKVPEGAPGKKESIELKLAKLALLKEARDHLRKRLQEMG